MRIAPRVVLTREQQKQLEQQARSRTSPARVVERSRIVLLAAAGKRDLEIGAELKISPQKAARWRARFLKLGLEGLAKDAPRPGRTPTIGETRVQEVIRRTTQEKPNNATHWSTRTMAAAVGN